MEESTGPQLGERIGSPTARKGYYGALVGQLHPDTLVTSFDGKQYRAGMLASHLYVTYKPEGQMAPVEQEEVLHGKPVVYNDEKVAPVEVESPVKPTKVPEDPGDNKPPVVES